MIEIDAAEARRLRARAQLLGGSELEPTAVVARAGAMQGQDLGAVLRAIALRSRPGTTVADVRAAFDAGALVRGWPMRGTLFAVTPADLAGIVALTAPKQQSALRNRRKFLGLTDQDYERARVAAEQALAAGPLARDALAERWREAGLPDGPGISYHLTSTLAINGVLALGAFGGKEQLVVGLAPSAEEPAAVLGRLARAYFAARGPATLDDFAWWTKLPKSSLAPAVGAIEDLEEVSVDGVPMRWLDDGVPAADPPRSLDIPAFDEWILGYRDRSLIATPEALAQLVTVNGIFRAARLDDWVAVGRAA